MKITSVTVDDLAGSVLAVPPLARHSDLSLSAIENRKLIRYIEDGGVHTLMYGSNANFYNIPLSEYADTLELSRGQTLGRRKGARLRHPTVV